MATLKVNFIFVIVAAVFISNAACFHQELEAKKIEVFKMQMRMMCNKSETDTEFTVIVNETLTNFATCVEKSLVAASSHQNIEEPNVRSINSKIRSACYAAPSLTNCYHNMSKSFEFCYNETQLKQSEKSLELLDQLQILMCTDQGKRIINIYNKIECISERVDYKNCFKTELDIIEKFKNVTISEIQSANPFGYLAHDCTRIEEIETCITKGVSQCDDKNVLISTEDSPTFDSLEDTTRKIFSLVKNAMECKNNEIQEPQVSIIQSLYKSLS